jgi:tRNA A-37 threonylcarbamoyl transferase component Bud32
MPINLEECDQVLDRFESAWQECPPPDIADFLPQAPAVRRNLLPELVMIDLEYRWRRPLQKAPGQFPARPCLEDYFKSFPELEQVVSIGLIGEEYRVRQRWGDRPDHAEYTRRFPSLGDKLEMELIRIDAELENDRFTRNLDRRSGTRVSGNTARVHCPHCGQSIVLPAAEMPRNLACAGCGGTFSLESLSAVPDRTVQPPFARLGRYELGELLGTGAFGSVWRARDTDLSRDVALKLPRNGQFLEPNEEERFLREARAAARLQHPGIVAIHDIGRDQETHYIVSELVPGMTLAEFSRKQRLSFREAAELTARVADALDFAHQRGVVHRDVKPSNIMLSNEERGDVAGEGPPALVPRLMDFGLALGNAGEVTMTLDGQVLGTPGYMSPEQVRNPHGVDGRSDLYSLGVVLYELLTGEIPFRGMTRMVLEQVLIEEPRPPRRLNDRIPRDLETICLQCLEKDPGHRYRTAGALAADLRRWLAGEAIRARPIGWAQRSWLWVRRNPVPAITISLALAALVASMGIATSLIFLGLTALAIGSLLFALYQTKKGNDLTHAIAFAGQDQRKAAAALNVSLKQCLQARKERDRAAAAEARAKRRFTLLRKLAKVFLFDLPGRFDEANPSPVRLFLIQTALAYLDGLAKESRDDPLLMREVAVGYGRVGDLQENQSEALSSYRRSLELFAGLAQNLPLNTQAQRDWAAAQEKVKGLERIAGNAMDANPR